MSSEKVKVKKVDKKEKKKKQDRYSYLSDNFKRVLKEEEVIREKLSQLRKELGEKRDQRDDELAKKRKEEPEDTLSIEINELKDKRDAEKRRLRQKEDRTSDLKSILARSALTDSISDARFQLEQLRNESSELRAQIRPLLDQINKLEAQKKTLKLPAKFKSLKEIDIQLEQVNKKKAHAAEKAFDSVLKDLGRKEHELKNARVMMETVTKCSDALEAALSKAGDLGAKKTEIDERKEKLEKKLDAQIEERKNSRVASKEKNEGVSEEAKAIASNVKKLNDEINEKMKERTQKIKARNEARKDDESGAEIQALIKKRVSLQKELAELDKEIPYKVVKIDDEFSGAVLGRGGVIADQLSLDFGCIISVNGATVSIRGGDDQEACAEAILAIVEEAKTNRIEESVDYPPEFLKRNEIARMESTSGARIIARKDLNKVTIIGNAEEVTMAKELIAEFALNSYREEVELGEELGKIVRLKRFRDIQVATGVKIFLTAQHKAIVTGKKEGVQSAVKLIEENIKTLGSDSVEIQIPNGVFTRDIIGEKGSRINTIEEQTKTVIIIKKETIMVHGTKEGINECKQFLKSVFKENMKETIEIPYQPQLLDLLNSPYKAPGSEPEPEPEHEPEPEIEEKGEAGGEEEQEENGHKEEETNGVAKEGGEVKSKKKRVRRKKAKTFLQFVIRTTEIDICRAHPAKGVVFIRGKVDAAKAAEKLIKDFLEANKVAIEKVSCPEGLPRFMKKGQVVNLFNSIKKLPGLTGASPPRGAAVNFIEIYGPDEAVAAALPKAKELVSELGTKIAVFPFERARAGAIVGKGGVTIKSLEKEFKATLDIDKFNGKCFALVAEAKSVKEITEKLEEIIAKDKEERKFVSDYEPTAKGSGKGSGKGYSGGKGKGGKGGSSGGKGAKPAAKKAAPAK